MMQASPRMVAPRFSSYTQIIRGDQVASIIGQSPPKTYVIAARAGHMLESASRTDRYFRINQPVNILQMAKRSLSVSIIGAGRVGTALAMALVKAGHTIDLVVARRPASVRRASRLIGGKTHGFPAAELGRLKPLHRQVLADSPVLIIATPDDVIESVARQIGAALHASISKHSSVQQGKVALHTSGALSAAALAPLRAAGFAIGSLHPLISISDSKTGAAGLAHAYFSLEGDPAAVRTGKRLVHQLGGRSFEINAKVKALYHAAALMASPNMTALFDVALEMLSRCGLSRNHARKVLLPLVDSTLQNLSTQDPSRALTGTFKRGDLDTARKHLAAIKSRNLSEALAAYVVLGRHSLRLAGHSRSRAAAINRLLTSALKDSRKQS